MPSITWYATLKIKQEGIFAPPSITEHFRLDDHNNIMWRIMGDKKSREHVITANDGIIILGTDLIKNITHFELTLRQDPMKSAKVPPVIYGRELIIAERLPIYPLKKQENVCIATMEDSRYMASSSFKRWKSDLVYFVFGDTLKKG